MTLMMTLSTEAQAIDSIKKENESNSLSQRLTVAVLLLEDKTADQQTAHWRYCVTGMLDGQLSIIKAVRLLPQDSVKYAFKQLDLNKDASVNADQAKRIGEIIEAQRVVWGSYRKENNQWKVQARVLNVASGKVSGELTVTSGDLFEVRDKLVEKILIELDVTPSQTERQKLGKRKTTSYDALEYVSKAMALQEEGKPLSEQEDCLRKAIAADAQFAHAYVGLAATLCSQGKFKEAEDAARKALKTDPNDELAHLVLGTILFFQENFTEAETELRTAYNLEPDNSEALVRLGEVYSVQGKLNEAIAFTEKAILIDFANPAIHAKLGFLYAKNRERDKAMSSLKEAERLSSDNINAEQLLCQAYHILGEIPSAVEHYERFSTQARQLGANPQAIASFEETANRLKQTLTPTYMKISMPKIYNEQELQAALRAKLSESEMKKVINPIAGNPEMKRFAQQQVKDANTDFDKAKAIYEALLRRIKPEGKGGFRTAEEVFKAWNEPNESFSCQEYAKLFIALARDVNVNVFYVHVDKIYTGEVVNHDCAVIFLGGKALLVDVSSMWFGVPHKKFEAMDDFQAIAHHMFHSKDMSQCQIAVKLQPDSAWGRAMLGNLLLKAKRPDEARKEIEVAVKLEPDRWDVYLLQGVLEAHANNFEAATIYLRKALALNPQSAESHYYLGFLLSNQGKLSEALEEYRLCLRYDPTPEMSREAQRMIAEINEFIYRQRKAEKAITPAYAALPEQPNSVPLDPDLLQILINGANKGDANAQFNLGLMYEYGQGVPQDYEEAVKWYKKAAEQNFAGAQYNLGLLCEDGKGLPQDYKESVKWYTKAAEHDFVIAQHNLALLYANGQGVPQDYKEAVKWYTKAAEQGDANSQYNLGLMYAYGKGVPQNYKEAVKWYTKAAEQGLPRAQYRLVYMYCKDKDFTGDSNEMVKCLKKFADQGLASAQCGLGSMYDYGKGVPQDYKEAVKWFTKAAEQGDTLAQYSLGLMYVNGKGVPQDYKEAFKWITKAAEQGNAGAQYDLGVMYENGEGVPQDYKEAVKWYTKAAEQGEAFAQYKLGILYYQGQGVPQDYKEAVKCFTKAAEQGDAMAQHNLGVMYYKGQGAAKDYVEAYKWAFIAGLNGRDVAGLKHALFAEMTPAQIDEGQKRANEFIAKKEKETANDSGYSGLK
jgi:uncharacterized protein